MSDLKAAAIFVVKTLQNNGFTAYFAGGYVRDLIMKHPSDDIDIATTANVEEIQKLFPKTIPVGVQFGIVVVVVDSFQFEVATFRREDGYQDGRRPTNVVAAPPQEDAQRRDFTINGMFYDPISEEIHDFVGGRRDIQARVIRAIGDANARFLEDRLRMIRAVRYSARFHFAIETKTKRAIVKHARALFPAVAIERVWQELQKMARFSNFADAIIGLHEFALLPVIFPELYGLPIETIEERTARFAHFPKSTPLVAFLLELFPDYTLPQKIIFCEKFKLSNKDRNFVLFYDELLTALVEKQPLDPYHWTYIYANPDFKVAFDTALAHFEIAERDEVIKHHLKQENALHEFIARIKNHDPVVKAKHLLDRGVKPGPEMGQLLKKAERISINQQISDPKVIIEKLLQRG